MNGGGQTNVSIIKEFFRSQSSAGDLAGVLSETSIIFQVVIIIIMFIGAIALAIWLLRIGADMIAIVTATRGDKASGVHTHATNWGTGDAGNYINVWTYLKKNLLNIILVILLLFILFSGYIFTLIAMAIDGLGTLANKLFNLDVGGKLSALDAETYANNIESQKTVSLRNQYDEQLSGARENANQLYDKAKGGVGEDDPALVKMKSQYTQNMVKANILADELRNRGAETEYKLGEGYFRQHLMQSGDGVCNESFLLDDVIQEFNVSGADANVTCQ